MDLWQLSLPKWVEFTVYEEASTYPLKTISHWSPGRLERQKYALSNYSGCSVYLSSYLQRNRDSDAWLKIRLTSEIGIIEVVAVFSISDYINGR